MSDHENRKWLLCQFFCVFPSVYVCRFVFVVRVLAWRCEISGHFYSFFLRGGNHLLFSFIWPKSIKSISNNKTQDFFCSVSIPKSGMATTQKPGANPSFPLQSPTHRQCGYEFSTILNSLSISFLSASWILNCFSSYQNVEKVVSWTLYNWQEWDGEESTKSCINPWHGISVK